MMRSDSIGSPDARNRVLLSYETEELMVSCAGRGDQTLSLILPGDSGS